MQPLASLALTVNVKLPCALGVPESVPVLEKVSPVGKEPDVTVKLYGALPPLAVMVAL